MRLVVQRVDAARCSVDGRIVGKINRGSLVFLGIGRGDNRETADQLLSKLLGLRIFPDESGRMNYDLKTISGELLLIPQFTLYGDVSRGLRPSFDAAAPPGRAREIYHYFVEQAALTGVSVATGKFGAMMQISAENNGPVTIIIDSDD